MAAWHWEGHFDEEREFLRLSLRVVEIEKAPTSSFIDIGEKVGDPLYAF